ALVTIIIIQILVYTIIIVLLTYFQCYHKRIPCFLHKYNLYVIVNHIHNSNLNLCLNLNNDHNFNLYLNLNLNLNFNHVYNFNLDLNLGPQFQPQAQPQMEGLFNRTNQSGILYNNNHHQNIQQGNQPKFN